MIDKRNFYINGEWTAPIAGTDFPVQNPATEEPFAMISLGGAADAEAAIAAARAAFPAWSATSPEERKGYLKAILEVYEAHANDMPAQACNACMCSARASDGHTKRGTQLQTCRCRRAYAPKLHPNTQMRCVV